MLQDSKEKAKATAEVLLVEDNPEDAFLLRKALLEKGGDVEFRVTHIETLQQTLDLLCDKSFDLILLDLNLSDSERMKTVKSVAGATDAAIIVMTSQPDETLALKAIRAGIQDFLSKDKIGSPEMFKSIRFALERQTARNRLHHLAYRDDLTGLPNLNAFADRCGAEIERATLQGGTLAVHVIALCNLKDIVMAEGLHVGEAALRIAANRLYGTLQADKFLARLDGDRLGLMQAGAEYEGQVLYVARRIIENLSQPLDIQGQSAILQVDVGIALCPQHGGDWDSVYHHACLALERSAPPQGGRCFVFSEEQGA